MVVAIYVTHARLERGDGRCRVLLVLRRSRDKGGAPSGWRRRCRRFDNASDVVERTSARARASCVPLALAWRTPLRRRRATRDVARNLRPPRSHARRALRPRVTLCRAMLFPPSTFRGPHSFRARVLPIANGSTRHTCDHVIFDLLPKPRRTRLIRRARGDVEVSGAAGASQRAAALPP
jgi:hypothetical protein